MKRRGWNDSVMREKERDWEMWERERIGWKRETERENEMEIARARERARERQRVSKRDGERARERARQRVSEWERWRETETEGEGETASEWESEIRALLWIDRGGEDKRKTALLGEVRGGIQLLRDGDRWDSGRLQSIENGEIEHLLLRMKRNRRTIIIV